VAGIVTQNSLDHHCGDSYDYVMIGFIRDREVYFYKGGRLGSRLQVWGIVLN